MIVVKNTNEILKTLGAALRHKRLQMRLSQAELSQRTNIPLSTLQRLEQRGLGAVENLVVVCRELHLLDKLNPLLTPAPELANDYVAGSKTPKRVRTTPNITRSDDTHEQSNSARPASGQSNMSNNDQVQPTATPRSGGDGRMEPLVGRQLPEDGT